MMGDEGAAAIQGMVKSASDPGKGVIATVVGVVTLLFGATTVFGELQSALDRIWRSPAAEKKEGIWNLIRTRVLSFGMILGIGFLLLVSLVVSAAISAVGSLWGSWFGGFEVLLQFVNFAFSFVVVTALFALIYKFLPRVTHQLARRLDRRRRDRAALHDRQVPDRPLHRQEQRGVRVRRRGIARRGADLGLLLRADLPARCGVHLGVQLRVRLPQGRGAARCLPRARRRKDAGRDLARPAPAASRSVPARDGGRRARSIRPMAPAARKATTLLNRYPQAGLGLAVLLGGLAAIAARWTGRLR